MQKRPTWPAEMSVVPVRLGGDGVIFRLSLFVKGGGDECDSEWEYCKGVCYEQVGSVNL